MAGLFVDRLGRLGRAIADFRLVPKGFRGAPELDTLLGIKQRQQIEPPLPQETPGEITGKLISFIRDGKPIE